MAVINPLDTVRTAQTLGPQLPQTQLVHLSDCESDLYELFALAGSCPDGPAVLVRARHDRAVATAVATRKPKRLFAFLHAQPVAGEITVTVPRRPGQKERIATLAIRFTPVTLLPPTGKAAQGPIPLWAVEAHELHPPRRAEPIHWRLLTTLPVTSFEHAVEKVRWYALRWRIEEFHRVLKSGCRAEDAPTANRPAIAASADAGFDCGVADSAADEAGTRGRDERAAGDGGGERSRVAGIVWVHPSGSGAARMGADGGGSGGMDWTAGRISGAAAGLVSRSDGIVAWLASAARQDDGCRIGCRIVRSEEGE